MLIAVLASGDETAGLSTCRAGVVCCFAVLLFLSLFLLLFLFSLLFSFFAVKAHGTGFLFLSEIL